MPTKRAVYTALLGGYERLNDQAVAEESGIPFICFTDDPELKSDTWEIRLVEPLLPLDMVRSQRDLKIRGHESLDEFSETLYIDNSVALKRSASDILDEWLGGSDFTVAHHSYRDRVIDEFDEVVALGYDDGARVNEQLIHYSELYPDILLERPHWNGILARRQSQAVNRTMDIWFDHVLRYSRRDQLSANVAFSLGGVQLRSLELDNWLSPSHAWPVEAQRKAHLGKVSRRKVGPLLAEVARAERETAAARASLDELTAKADEANAHHATQVSKFETEVANARRAAEEERSRGDVLEKELIEYIRQLEDLRNSASWKMTAPIRRVLQRPRGLGKEKTH
ncbi:hypothetical protein [Agreia sp. Leaf335]|uniref:hypothetical protein n=1 Tax=Agreia sp. Leaf335 TaxID=1736340 RepID=UPI0006F9A5F1|nr:hypothetical protein [Agreia sp. Leaf335]